MSDIVSYDMLINGQWVQASDGATFDSRNPSNGAVWARFPAATSDDVDNAVEVLFNLT